MDLAPIIDQFEQQLVQGDLPKAAHTLAKIEIKIETETKSEPNPELQPQLLLLQAKLHQAQGQRETAEAAYRTVLKTTTNAKLLSQARQGLQTILDAERQAQEWRITQAKAQPNGEALAFLVLHPLPSSWSKKAAAAKIARIFRTDPATATTWIPLRQPKLLRLGLGGELATYSAQLQELGIPSFWFSLNQINQVAIAQVTYFELIDLDQIIAHCQDQPPIQFNLNQIQRQVTGAIPIFSKVATLDAKFQATSKEQILDYIHICDLHLDLNSDRDSQPQILRFHDNAYDFGQGVQLAVNRPLPHLSPTVQQRWQALINWWRKIAPDRHSTYDFVSFGEALLGYTDLLREAINPQLHLAPRQSEPLKTREWDRCFHLFSLMHLYSQD
ncbi:MAG: hypothetical protein SFT94_00765 [Pseudanabaenaceae cyanobacterium bins.68]|nr:hypothetical protein [Pseudanabaenaceae cyanobacterium bins.68]